MAHHLTLQQRNGCGSSTIYHAIRYHAGMASLMYSWLAEAVEPLNPKVKRQEGYNPVPQKHRVIRFIRTHQHQPSENLVRTHPHRSRLNHLGRLLRERLSSFSPLAFDWHAFLRTHISSNGRLGTGSLGLNVFCLIAMLYKQARRTGCFDKFGHEPNEEAG